MNSSIDKLKKMREQLQASQGGGAGGGSRDNSVYPFWSIEVGGSATLRFLPDKNPDNLFMWAEKILFKWTFADPRKPGAKVQVSLPCQEMYDGFKTCAVMAELRPLWKQDEETARKFWPKKSYIYNGFVRRSTFNEQTTPDSPIRKFLINKKMHGFIRESILSDNPDTAFLHSPDDFVNGRDFVVQKTKNGVWDDYGTSRWANNSTPLTDAEIAAIEKHGLIDLKTAFPPRPSVEAFAVMPEILRAAIDGQPWNPDWDVHFKTYAENGNSRGNDGGDDSPALPAARPATGNAAAAIDRIRGTTSAPKEEVAADKPVTNVFEQAKVESAKEEAPASSQQGPAQTVKSDDVMARLRALREKSQKAS